MMTDLPQTKPPVFQVWDPDNTDESGSRRVDVAWSIEDAASCYVEGRPDYLTDNCDKVNVFVRAKDGKLYEVCVEIEHEVTYRAGRAELYEPEPPPLLTSVMCPKCNGKRTVMERDHGPTGDGDAYYEVECRKCDGTGEVPNT
jgi:hypothetical protein